MDELVEVVQESIERVVRKVLEEMNVVFRERELPLHLAVVKPTTVT